MRELTPVSTVTLQQRGHTVRTKPRSETRTRRGMQCTKALLLRLLIYRCTGNPGRHTDSWCHQVLAAEGKVCEPSRCGRRAKLASTWSPCLQRSTRAAREGPGYSRRRKRRSATAMSKISCTPSSYSTTCAPEDGSNDTTLALYHLSSCAQ
jgi:hypothetical protein